jgi:hypothetical protein
MEEILNKIIIYMWFCKYRYMLGKPKEGIHSIRYLNIAIIDVLLTILLAKFIQYYFMKEENIWLILFLTFILGIFLHRLFCVRTTIDKLLFS